MQMRNSIGLALCLVAIAALVRLLPHAPNFTAVAAVAMFAAVYLPRRWALTVPILAMLASDAFIGFYDWRIMLAVYGSLLLSAGLGWMIRNRVSVGKVIGASLAGSTLFFLLTNGAVWLFGTLYPKTAAGLMEAYAMGLPFFRNTLLGDLVYTGMLFGGYAVLRAATRAAGTTASIAGVETLQGKEGIQVLYGQQSYGTEHGLARVSQESDG